MSFRLNDIQQQPALSEKIILLKENIGSIAKGIFELRYLKPFNNNKKVDLYTSPIERTIHGVQHAGRVGIYIPIIINFLKSIGYDSSHESEIFLILLGLHHDMGREGEGKDVWEKISKQYYEEFMETLGIDKLIIKEFSKYITHEGSGTPQDIFQSSDSIDIMRIKRELILEKVHIYQLIKPEDLTFLLLLIIEMRSYIAFQHDLKHPCEIKLHGEVLVDGIPPTFNLDLKRNYEHSPNAWQKMVDDLVHFPMMYSLFHGKLINDYKSHITNTLKQSTIYPAANGVGHFICFTNKLDCENLLMKLKVILNNADPSIKHAKASEYKVKATDTPYRFRLLDSQLTLINNIHLLKSLSKPTAAIFHLPKTHFGIKALRTDTDNYYFEFIEELLDPQHEFPKRTERKKKFTVTGSGVFKRNPESSSLLPIKKPQYPPEIRIQYTKFQSITLGLSDYYPPVFGAFNRSDSLVGFIFDNDLMLLSDRISQRDFGSRLRPYDFDNENNAHKYYQGKPFFSVNKFDKYKVTIKGSSFINEPLVHLKLAHDGRLKSFIGSDNLESRLLAKEYAQTFLKKILSQKGHYSNVMLSGKYSKHYIIPTIFYIPYDTKLSFKEYTQAEYDNDCQKAVEIFNDNRLMAEKFRSLKFEFLLGLAKDNILQLSTTNMNHHRINLPFFIHLLDKEYIHIFRFLIEKHELDFDSVIGEDIKRLKDNSELMIKIFHKAISSYYIKFAEWLIKTINFKLYQDSWSHSYSLLNTAIKKKVVPLVKQILLFPFIDINKNGDGLAELKQAVDVNSMEIVECLLRHRRDFDIQSILIHAAYSGKIEMIKHIFTIITPSENTIKNVIQAVKEFERPSISLWLEQQRQKRELFENVKLSRKTKAIEIAKANPEKLFEKSNFTLLGANLLPTETIEISPLQYVLMTYDTAMRRLIFEILYPHPEYVSLVIQQENELKHRLDLTALNNAYTNYENERVKIKQGVSIDKSKLKEAITHLGKTQANLPGYLLREITAKEKCFWSFNTDFTIPEGKASTKHHHCLVTFPSSRPSINTLPDVIALLDQGYALQRGLAETATLFQDSDYNTEVDKIFFQCYFLQRQKEHEEDMQKFILHAKSQQFHEYTQTLTAPLNMRC